MYHFVPSRLGTVPCGKEIPVQSTCIRWLVEPGQTGLLRREDQVVDLFGLQGVHVAPLIGVHDGGERDEDGDALLEVEVANEELRRRTAMWRAERIGRGGDGRRTY